MDVVFFIQSVVFVMVSAKIPCLDILTLSKLFKRFPQVSYSVLKKINISADISLGALRIINEPKLIS